MKIDSTKINHFFDYVFKLLVTAVAIWAVFVMSNFLFAAKPFEFYLDPSVPTAYTLCPGESFSYKSSLIVRKTPITLVRSDTWFNEKTERTIIPDNYTTMEIFNWDQKVKEINPDAVMVTVPRYTNKGKPIAAGEYRYIVNLNAWGDSKPASISFNVTVPATCPS